MPFTAVCPYCRIGRVQTPDDARGRATRCPHCRADFTPAPPEEWPPVPLNWPAGEPTTPPRQTQEAASPRLADTSPWYAVAEPVRSQRPAEEVDTVVVPVAPTAATPKVAKPYTDWDADEPHPPPAITMATIVALFLVAVGLIASQFPYGRTITVAAALVGIGFAVVGWFVSGGVRLPAVATGLNVVLLVVVIVLPSWLGIESWHPPEIGPDPKVVRQFGPDGLAPTAPEWIDGDRAWQFDDVRVQVMGVTAGAVELTGPDGKKRWSKGRYLVVTAKVSNVGVARPVPVPMWELSPAKPDDPVPTLVDAGGAPIPRATFEAGWRATLTEPPATLLPTHSGERTLLFQLPAAPTDYVRLELPATEFGAPQPVRFQLSAKHIPPTGKKNP